MDIDTVAAIVALVWGAAVAAGLWAAIWDDRKGAHR